MVCNKNCTPVKKPKTVEQCDSLKKMNNVLYISANVNYLHVSFLLIIENKVLIYKCYNLDKKNSKC